MYNLVLGSDKMWPIVATRCKDEKQAELAISEMEKYHYNFCSVENKWDYEKRFGYLKLVFKPLMKNYPFDYE
jgi:hypothetical protein